MYRVTRLNVAVERREYIMLYIKQQNKIVIFYMVLSLIFIRKFKTIKTSIIRLFPIPLSYKTQLYTAL